MENTKNLSAAANYKQILAGDKYVYRNTAKLLQYQPYTYNPPFGLGRESLRPCDLVHNPNPRPLSPIIDRFPTPNRHTQSVTKVDFTWVSAQRPMSPVAPGRLNEQRAKTTALSRPRDSKPRVDYQPMAEKMKQLKRLSAQPCFSKRE